MFMYGNQIQETFIEVAGKFVKNMAKLKYLKEKI
jgi:hypothetical protein